MSKFLSYGGDALFSYVNPDSYTENCVNCAIAIDLNIKGAHDTRIIGDTSSYVSCKTTKQGLKYSALPSTFQTVNEIEDLYSRRFQDILTKEDIREAAVVGNTNEILLMGMKMIRSTIQDTGENSRGIIFVQSEAKNGEEEGHVFNVWNKGKGTVEFVDGQKNKIVTGFSQEIIRLFIT
jgi:Papain fold toxin 1, glutamine deamidase